MFKRQVFLNLANFVYDANKYEYLSIYRILYNTFTGLLVRGTSSNSKDETGFVCSNILP